MKENNKNKIRAAHKVAFFILLAVMLILPIFQTTSVLAATTKDTLTELEKQKKQAEAEAKKAEALKAQKERQASEAQNQAEYLEKQVTQIKQEEEVTSHSIDATQNEINGLSTNISDTEKKEAEERRRSQEIARVFFKQRKEYSLDSELGGELDVLTGDSVSDSVSQKQKIEKALELLRSRTAKLIVTRIDLNTKKSEAQDKHTQLTQLKEEKVRLRRARENTQVRYERLASVSSAQADQYEQEMIEAYRKIATYEEKIRAELARRISARKQGGIPRTGATVGQKVGRGDVIGHEGNTGYSTGPHTHFEVRENNSPTNPRNYAGSSISWPFSEPYRVTQEFGVTPYSRRLYASGVHYGIDLDKYYGANVAAVCSGEIILDEFYGGYGRAFAHTCDGTNLVILYGHLQAE